MRDGNAVSSARRDCFRRLPPDEQGQSQSKRQKGGNRKGIGRFRDAGERIFDVDCEPWIELGGPLRREPHRRGVGECACQRCERAKHKDRVDDPGTTSVRRQQKQQTEHCRSVKPAREDGEAKKSCPAAIG